MAPEMFKVRDQLGLLPLQLCTCPVQRSEVEEILKVEDDMDEVTKAFTICKLVASHDRAAAEQLSPSGHDVHDGDAEFRTGS